MLVDAVICVKRWGLDSEAHRYRIMVFVAALQRKHDETINSMCSATAEKREVSRRFESAKQAPNYLTPRLTLLFTRKIEVYEVTALIRLTTKSRDIDSSTWVTWARRALFSRASASIL